MSNYDIIIIGGGVIGLSLARELRRAGAGGVAIVERGRAGREASYAAAGMLAPNAECEAVDDFYRFCDASRRMFPRLAEELLEETGIDIELDRGGTLYTAFTEGDSRHISVRFARQRAAGISVERLSATETLAAEPHLSPSVRESLFFPDDWQVENRRLLAALRRFADLNGIEIFEEAPVDAIEIADGRAIGVRSRRGTMRAGTVVLATGAWSSLIKIADAAAVPDIRPIRGQIVSFGNGERMLIRVIYSPRGYLVPRADGRILAGATVEDVGFDPSTTDEAVSFLSETAVEIVPAIANLKIAENWAGLRPFAPGGLPIIGPLLDAENVLVATGHYRNGILLAPITAAILADRIVNGVESEYFELFGPDRGENYRVGFRSKVLGV